MAHGFLALRGAGEPARATPHRLAFLAHDLRPAHRACHRHRPRAGAARAFAVDHAHDFGNHIARAAHDHGVADAHVQARHLVCIVQRRAGDDDARHLHRPQACHRRRRARAANLDVDRLQHRRLLLRGKLVRDRPARRTRDEAHLALQRVVVELVDDAVDIERQLRAALANRAVVGEQPRRPRDDGVFSADRHAPVAKSGERGRMRGRQLTAVDGANRIRIERQRTLRRDAWVELSQRTRRPVAWIGERTSALGDHSRVVGIERLDGHEDFAAHVEQSRPAAAAQLQRNAADGAHIRGHVLAGGAIAARGRDRQPAILVAQADGEAVHLRLDRKRRVANVQRLLDAAHEVGDLVVAERIRQRQHRHGMPHLRERAHRHGAHALRG